MARCAWRRGSPSPQFANALVPFLKFVGRCSTPTKLQMNLQKLASAPLVSLARLLEVRENLGAQCNLILMAPAAEPFAGLEAELAVSHELLKIRRRSRAALDIGQHRFVNRERQISTDKIGILQRPQRRKASPERGLDHGVNRLGIADAALDQ